MPASMIDYRHFLRRCRFFHFAAARRHYARLFFSCCRAIRLRVIVCCHAARQFEVVAAMPRAMRALRDDARCCAQRWRAPARLMI